MQRFEWDENKARSNLRKHGISFEQAILVFADPFQMVEHDRLEGGEIRWKTTGSAGGYLIAVVAHTIKDDEQGTETIRIISARRAEPNERRRYEEQ